MSSASAAARDAGYVTPSSCFAASDQRRALTLKRKAIARLPKAAKLWLLEDVKDIISPEERCAFLKLSTNGDRDGFIEQFWSRRSPDPKSLTNAFKLEHYERIAIADQKFGARVPGLETDRGRVYVTLGAPDSIVSGSVLGAAGASQEGTVKKRALASETWHYVNASGIGRDLDLVFIIPPGSRDYRLKATPTMGTNALDSCAGFAGLGCGEPKSPSSVPPRIFVGPLPSPVVHFRDLNAAITSQIVLHQTAFSYRIEFSRATHATSLAHISIAIAGGRSSSGSDDRGGEQFEVFGRVKGSSGWIFDMFERLVSAHVPGTVGPSQSDCHVDLPIRPGTYELAIAVKDVTTGHVGILRSKVVVPIYDQI